MEEAAVAVPVEEITEEHQSGTHRYFHLVRLQLKIPSPKLHLRFVHRVKLRLKPMQKTFVYDLNI